MHLSEKRPFQAEQTLSANGTAKNTLLQTNKQKSYYNLMYKASYAIGQNVHTYKTTHSTSQCCNLYSYQQYIWMPLSPQIDQNWIQSISLILCDHCFLLFLVFLFSFL